MNLDETWSYLENQQNPTSRQGVLARRISPGSKCDLYLGVQRPEMFRLFLVVVDSQIVPNPTKFPETRGWSVDLMRLPENEPHQVTLRILLLDLHYADLFNILIDDVVRHIAHCLTHRESVKGCLDRLQRWKQFFEQRSVEGMNEEAQRGLLGELIFMKDVLFEAVGGDRAVSCWRGPEMDTHDFRLPRMSVEVKTTSSKEHSRLTIANELQLDDIASGRLFLFSVGLTPANENGFTLPMVVQKFREMLTGSSAALAAFEDKLLDSGYLAVHVRTYTSRYLIRTTNIFEVREGFPRLTPASLAPGVGDVRYSVMVSACMPFACKPPDFTVLLRESFNEH